MRSGRPGAFFRPSQVTDAGITRDQLRALVRRGTVEHAGRGLYRLTDAESTEDDSLAMACARVPTIIVALREQQAEAVTLGAAIAANLEEMGYGS